MAIYFLLMVLFAEKQIEIKHFRSKDSHVGLCPPRNDRRARASLIWAYALQFKRLSKNCHCEERSDVAIYFLMMVFFTEKRVEIKHFRSGDSHVGLCPPRNDRGHFSGRGRFPWGEAP